MRILVTSPLPGQSWHDLLTSAGCQVDIQPGDGILTEQDLVDRIGDRCDAAIGQLTEPWNARVFEALRAAGGRAYSTFAVGFDNIDIDAATRCGIKVGNTPGVLTEATSELAVALTLAAGRDLVPADHYTRDGKFTAWLPDLYLGTRFHGLTLGIVGAGRIGCCYARSMVAAHQMDLIYYSRSRKPELEREMQSLSSHFANHGQRPVSCAFTDDLDSMLATADVLALHTPLTPHTRHLIDARRLALMKPTAILVNTSRGPVIDESALVEHLRSHPDFRAALDVYEHEPALTPGLTELPNTVLLPHLGSATHWSRQHMAELAAGNVLAVLTGDPSGAPSLLNP